MTEVAEAESLILAHMPRFAAREEPLAACVDRVLAEDVASERDQPPFDRVTMDGIAVNTPLAATVFQRQQMKGVEPFNLATGRTEPWDLQRVQGITLQPPQ